MINERLQEGANEMTKMAPPVGVVGLSILGIPISDWVQVATLIYVLLQMHILGKKNLKWYSSMLDWMKEVVNVKRSKG